MTVRSFFEPTLSEAALREQIHEALAKVRALDVKDLEKEINANGGNLQIDSKEAEVVLSMLEQRRLLKPNSVKVEDLEPEQLTTVAALVQLIAASLAA